VKGAAAGRRFRSRAMGSQLNLRARTAGSGRTRLGGGANTGVFHGFVRWLGSGRIVGPLRRASAAPNSRYHEMLAGAFFLGLKDRA